MTARLAEHRQLCCSKSSRWRKLLVQNALVKLLHQFAGRLVINAPQARDYTRGSGVHKTASNTHQSLALDLAAERRLAGAQNHEVGAEVEVVDVEKTQVTIFWPALLVHHGQRHSGQFRMLSIGDRVSGKVHDAILTERRAARQ